MKATKILGGTDLGQIMYAQSYFPLSLNDTELTIVFVANKVTIGDPRPYASNLSKFSVAEAYHTSILRPLDSLQGNIGHCAGVAGPSGSSWQSSSALVKSKFHVEMACTWRHIMDSFARNLE
jgi:hypothetical protein